MSQENVEIVRTALGSLEESVYGLLEFCSPEIEYRVRRDLPDARTYQGLAAVRGLASEWQRLFEDFRLESEEFVDAGDSVVALMHISGRGATSGVETGNPYGAVFELRDGRIWRISDYPTLAEALEAVGLQE